MATRTVRKKRSSVKIGDTYPVLYVYRSNKNLLIQLFDSQEQKTIFTLTTSGENSGTKTDKAVELGKKTAEKLKSLSIERVVVNRNGFRYHGRIKSALESIVNEGIKI